MFLSEHIPALFKKGTLKLEKGDDGKMRRVAEATLMIEPFPVHLARELGEDMAGHLFDDDGQIRQELEGIDLRVRAGLQRVTARSHEELDPEAVLDTVSIKDVSVKRMEDAKSNRSWLSLTFVLVFSLEDKAARNFVLDQFGRSLLWSFERIDPTLDGFADAKDAAARLAEAGGPGSSVSFGEVGGPMTTLTPDDAPRLRKEAANLRKRAH
jgi:hypothetical protein